MIRPLRPALNSTVPARVAKIVSSLPIAGAVAGLEAGAALAHDDLAAGDDLAGEHLHAQALGVRVAAVAAGSEPLLMSHSRSSFFGARASWRPVFFAGCSLLSGRRLLLARGAFLAVAGFFAAGGLLRRRASSPSSAFGFADDAGLRAHSSLMSLISILVRSARAPERTLYPRLGLNFSPWIFLPRSWPDDGGLDLHLLELAAVEDRLVGAVEERLELTFAPSSSRTRSTSRVSPFSTRYCLLPTRTIAYMAERGRPGGPDPDDLCARSALRDPGLTFSAGRAV